MSFGFRKRLFFMEHGFQFIPCIQQIERLQQGIGVQRPGQGEPQQKDGYIITLLATCEYFNVNKLDIETVAALEATDASFNSVLVLDGTFTIGGLELGKGDSVESAINT